MVTSKIFKLKKWLTLEEAADHLGGALQEPVSVVDLLRLAQDGHLTLSTNFVNHARVYKGRRVAFDMARMMIFPGLNASLSDEQKGQLSTFPKDGSREEQHLWMLANREISDSPDVTLTIRGDRISQEHVIEWESEVVSIDGIWDLPDFGGASLDIAHLLQSLVGGPEVTLVCLDGTVVVSPDGDRYAKVLERFEEGLTKKYPYGDKRNYFPSAGLPSDAPIVVRPEALTAFVASLTSEAPSRKDLGKREKSGLLRIIAGLAHEAKIDLKSNKAVAQITAAADAFGGPSELTVRKHVDAIREEVLPRK